MNKTEAKVEQYLNNEEALLYQDWYDSYYSTELFPGKPLAAKPSLAKTKEAFEDWFNQTRVQLYNSICIEWDYPGKKERYANEVALATALAEFLLAITWKTPSPIATATIIVKMGLDKLCKDCLKDESKSPKSQA